MADDWEAFDDSFVPVIPGVKDNWEDEEDLALKEAEEQKKKEELAKLIDAKVKAELKANPKPKAAPVKKAPVAKEEDRSLTNEERVKQHDAEQRSDYGVAEDLFSGIEDGGSRRNTDPILQRTWEQFDPNNEADFEELVQYIHGKTQPFNKKYDYPKFIKSLIKTMAEELSCDDLKEVGKAVDLIYNEKLKAKRGKPKKAASSKKTLTMERKDDGFGDIDGDFEGDGDDFM